MNMKNTVILLIFLLSVLGLLIGIHCTEDIDSDNSQNEQSNAVNEDSATITIEDLQKNESNVLNQFFT